MILTAFIQTLSTVMTALLQLLPFSEGFSPDFNTSLLYIINEALKWDYYLPIALGFSVLSIILGLHIAVYVWSGAVFMFSAVRGVRMH